HNSSVTPSVIHEGPKLTKAYLLDLLKQGIKIHSDIPGYVGQLDVLYINNKDGSRRRTDLAMLRKTPGSKRVSKFSVSYEHGIPVMLVETEEPGVYKIIPKPKD